MGWCAERVAFRVVDAKVTPRVGQDAEVRYILFESTGSPSIRSSSQTPFADGVTPTTSWKGLFRRRLGTVAQDPQAGKYPVEDDSVCC